MRDPRNIIITILGIIVFLFCLKHCKDINNIELSDTSALERIIEDQQKIIDSQKTAIYEMENHRDTLLFIETLVKYKYIDRYLFVENAGINELDSVLRLNTGLVKSDIPHTLTDSLKCYNRNELEVITTRLIRANECDTLLKIVEEDRNYADSIITAQETIITAKDTQLYSMDEIIALKNADIAALQEELFHDAKKNKWLKIGWIGTSGVLGSLLVLQLLK